MSSGGRHCKSCGRRGHYATTCPSKKDNKEANDIGKKKSGVQKQPKKRKAQSKTMEERKKAARKRMTKTIGEVAGMLDFIAEQPAILTKHAIYHPLIRPLRKIFQQLPQWNEDPSPLTNNTPDESSKERLSSGFIDCLGRGEAAPGPIILRIIASKTTSQYRSPYSVHGKYHSITRLILMDGDCKQVIPASVSSQEMANEFYKPWTVISISRYLPITIHTGVDPQTQMDKFTVGILIMAAAFVRHDQDAIPKLKPLVIEMSPAYIEAVTAQAQSNTSRDDSGLPPADASAS